MSKCSEEDDAQVVIWETCGEPDASRSRALTANRRKAPSPRRCRDFIRREAADAMPDIVKTFVQKAKDGSVPHFASLTKIGGFDKRPVAEAPKRLRRSLGRQLLDEVERYEAGQTAEAAAAHSQFHNDGPQERS